MSADVGIWLGALATLALYSILYRENAFYRAAEHIFIGLGTGYGIYMAWKTVLFPQWWVPMTKDGHWTWIFVFVAGMLYYAINIKRFVWMSRWIMITMLGLFSGMAFKEWANTFMPQILKSFKPLVITPVAFPYINFTNLIFIITLVTVMVYFLFSFEHKSKLVRQTAGTGRWLMMIAFGAIFGSTVMARMSLFIGRLYFLFHDWIRLIQS